MKKHHSYAPATSKKVKSAIAMPVAVLLGPMSDQRSSSRLEAIAQEANQYQELEIRFVNSDESLDKVIENCQDAVALIPAGVRMFDADFIAKLPNLRLIQTFSAGTDWMDKATLAELGVNVANNGGANAVAVAEHAIMLMLTIERKLDRQIQSVKDGTWMAGVGGERNDYHTLVGKRIGIVGLGRIGSRVAKRLQGWECEVVYYDVVDYDEDYRKATNAKFVELDELLETSDIVSLHVPLERTTRHMMSDREFGLMKPTAILVNTCRGPVVDEAALKRALEDGQIFGAGLDVTETEPIESDNDLPLMPNVVVTPHMATRAVESEENAVTNAIANVARVARGEKPLWVVPPV